MKLFDELADELSALEDPGCYDELPVAVVADELGLSLKQVHRLIIAGEVEATGRRAHERVSREELGMLVALGAEELLRRMSHVPEAAFNSFVRQLHSGNLPAAERERRRITAKQTCVGPYSLAAEIAFDLAKGRYDAAIRVVDFVVSEVPEGRHEVCTNLVKVISGVHFCDDEAKVNALRMLETLAGSVAHETVWSESDSDSLQSRARYIASVIESELEGPYIPRAPDHLPELSHFVRNAVYSALYAEARSQTSLKCRLFLLAHKRAPPQFREPATLLKSLRED